MDGFPANSNSLRALCDRSNDGGDAENPRVGGSIPPLATIKNQSLGRE
jgi:hypothetical protein